MLMTLLFFADNENMLQKGLEILYNYRTGWKLKVNTNKTKIMIFRGGILSRNLHFLYSGEKIEIVSKIHIPWYCFLYWRVFCRYI